MPELVGKFGKNRIAHDFVRDLEIYDCKLVGDLLAFGEILVKIAWVFESHESDPYSPFVVGGLRTKAIGYCSPESVRIKCVVGVDNGIESGFAEML